MQQHTVLEQQPPASTALALAMPSLKQPTLPLKAIVVRHNPRMAATLLVAFFYSQWELLPSRDSSFFIWSCSHDFNRKTCI
jgi:hypothetical protein